MDSLSRRRFLAGAAALAGGAATGLLSGCGSSVSISKSPDELVLWYWNRSISPTLLGQAAKQIPGTDKRLRADVIGGTFDTKLRTSLAGGAYIPDISGINSNCSLYFPSEDLFTDLNELGAAEHKDKYFDWKWQLGTTPTGRLCFWPMDTGPTGFYYRSDLFKKAGLPEDPEAVSEAGSTWESWIELGQKLKKNAQASIISNASMIFGQFINASPERYFDKQNRPLYAQEGSAVRKAWDLSVQAIKAGVTGNLQISTDQNSAWVSGKTAGHIEAVWWAEILKDTAPDTSGHWRLASQPVKPGNSGGSFLTVPKTAKDPEAAFAFISWLTSPENQAATFNEIQLFPSTPGSFTSGTMKGGGKFFGPQDELSFFEQAAKEVPTTFVSTYESQVGAFALELANVETGGKDPNRAWDDAVSQTDRVLKKRGVI
ncbi:extracellular solute-binding protein [Microlunatus panaciterrae]|uniref:Cellobiose transport system substrate-binding protein n=1 Tax=Microlunatus panaciterrae TaxID=400768 RepID=A0ABS2RME1_9ACTN|nr:extracellular solute-binding protein [Microlunatus panaciterrae]MBM7800147.1 cellobiose transport system substrate-binding protein [Microlunatus panaciterrae]